jgi:hypothetical protein
MHGWSLCGRDLISNGWNRLLYLSSHRHTIRFGHSEQRSELRILGSAKLMVIGSRCRRDQRLMTIGVN